MYLLVGYVIVVAAASLVAVAAYWLDKQSAQTGERRVPEQTLHLISLFGGWPGALAAQRLFRHKTRKLSFQLLFWLCVAVHLAAVCGAAYILLR